MKVFYIVLIVSCIALAGCAPANPDAEERNSEHPHFSIPRDEILQLKIGERLSYSFGFTLCDVVRVSKGFIFAEYQGGSVFIPLEDF